MDELRAARALVLVQQRRIAELEAEVRETAERWQRERTECGLARYPFVNCAGCHNYVQIDRASPCWSTGCNALFCGHCAETRLQECPRCQHYHCRAGHWEQHYCSV